MRVITTLKNSAQHQRHDVAVRSGVRRIVLIGVVELAAEEFHGLPQQSRRVVGLAGGIFRRILAEGVVAHRGHQRPRHAPAAHGVPAVAVQLAGTLGKPRRAADPLGTHHQRAAVVAGARTVADTSEVVGAVFAPVAGTGDLQSRDGTQCQPRRDVLRFVLVLYVEPFAVEDAEIIAQDPLSGLSASIAVKVVGEGVVSLSLSYVRNQDELKALGWGFGQTPASVNFDAEGMTVNMSLQSNSKYRADLKMASNDRPVVLNIGTYRYLAFRMDVPGNGSLKLDTNKGDYGNNPTGVLAEDSQVIYYDLQAKPYFPTDAPSDKLTTFQLKIADVTVQPYSYKVYWVRTFKTLEDLKVYVEKENNK